MIKESHATSLRHYLILFLVLIAGLAGLLARRGEKETQLSLIWSMAAAYIAWGVIHHWIHNDFHPKVILEYILITLLGVLPISALFLLR